MEVEIKKKFLKELSKLPIEYADTIKNLYSINYQLMII
jgi:mRNA-degrading endonuclease RelE of RelBE toxin-antitoxin system